MPVVLWFELDSGAGRPSLGVKPQSVDAWAPGTAFSVRGRLVSLGPGSSAAYGVRVETISEAPTPARADWADRVLAAVGESAARWRVGLRETARAIPGAALVPGFAVGDTALVPGRLAALMQQSSLTHLVAVSGANCALVVSSIISMSGLCGAGRRLRIVLGALALLGFVGVVGPDASLQRAAVMAAVMLVSAYGGKRAHALPSLGIAVLALLITNPWQALQPGFALSVSATAGILLWASDIAAGLRRVLPAPLWVRLPVAVAIAAQFSCGPLLLLVQDGFPAAGLIANVLAAPAAPWGTGLGLLAMLAVPLSSAVATACATAASWAAQWIAATAEVTAALPAARWPWPGGWGGALLLAAIEAALLLAWWIVRARPGDFTRHRMATGAEMSGPRPWAGAQARPRRVRAAIAALTCAALGAFLGPTLVAPAATRLSTPADWSVVACDVGQGDALLLRDPRAPDAVMLVDTGDDPHLLRACLDRFGVSRIALLLLSHDDRDHVGALPDIVDRVERALIAPAHRDSSEARAVVRQLAAAQVPTSVGVGGEHDGIGTLRWDVLAPRPGVVPADANAASQVVRVRAGDLSVLLLGDTGADEHLAMQREGADLEATVMKVAHHGSRDHDEALFEAVRPEIALISVGAKNSYGHPAASTVLGLERAGARVLRTDQSGTIALSGGAGNTRVWVERGD